MIRYRQQQPPAIDGIIVNSSLSCVGAVFLGRQVANIVVVQVKVHERPQLALGRKQVLLAAPDTSFVSCSRRRSPSLPGTLTVSCPPVYVRNGVGM